jgi:glycine betaine catabolism B
MKVVVKSSLRDLFSFIVHIKKRNKIFRKATKKIQAPGQMNILSSLLHPKQQVLLIDRVKIENNSITTYRLVPKEDKRVAFFRAGQFLRIDIIIDNNQISRPFSISSTPMDADNNNFYEITVKTKPNGFFTEYIKDNWKEGITVYTSEPLGLFYYEPLRDSKELICLAGGTGITPYRSIIKDTLENYKDVNITLFYGINSYSDIIFYDYFKSLEDVYSERFRFVVVCVKPPEIRFGEAGFITAELITKYQKKLSCKSFFVCGPGNFHLFIENELKQFNLPQKFIRRENYSVGRMEKEGNGSFDIDVSIESRSTIVSSVYGETILASLEKAGLHPPANCRSGECGWCRSKLVSGNIEVEKFNDGRRMADKKFGYFHPCSSFALSNLKIVCPENPVIIIKKPKE